MCYSGWLEKLESSIIISTMTINVWWGDQNPKLTIKETRMYVVDERKELTPKI